MNERALPTERDRSSHGSILFRSGGPLAGTFSMIELFACGANRATPLCFRCFRRATTLVFLHKKIEDASFGLNVAEDLVDEQALCELAAAVIRRGLDRTHECACASAAEKLFTRRRTRVKGIGNWISNRLASLLDKLRAGYLSESRQPTLSSPENKSEGWRWNSRRSTVKKTTAR